MYDDFWSALAKNDIRAVRRLIKKGADIESTDEFGRTPLCYAIVDRRYDMATLLISSGANVNHADSGNWIPLHFAAQNSDEPMIRLLLDSDSQVDAKNNHGNIPLQIAVFNYRGDPKIVQDLIAAGADRHHANIHGVSPVGLAETMGVDIAWEQE